MRKTRPNEWLYGQVGEELKRWVELGATIWNACDMVGISESKFHYWTQLAQRYPDSPMAQLIKELRAAEAVATNGHSTTGNIVGLGHGRVGTAKFLLNCLHGAVRTAH
jgi:hypothetical protein